MTGEIAYCVSTIPLIVPLKLTPCPCASPTSNSRFAMFVRTQQPILACTRLDTVHEHRSPFVDLDMAACMLRERSGVMGAWLNRVVLFLVQFTSVTGVSHDVRAHPCRHCRKYEDRLTTTVTRARTDQILQDNPSFRGHIPALPRILLREDWTWRSQITGMMAMNES